MATDSRSRWLVPLVGAATLIVGFAVASLTGNRALGGVVLVVGAAWCAWKWWNVVGPVRTLLALGVFAIAFAVSHPLGKLIGSWPSVLLVAAISAVATYFLCPAASTAEIGNSAGRSN